MKIARRILLDIIDALNIPRQKEEIAKDFEWNDKAFYEVPNVIGDTLDVAKEKLSNFEVVIEGEGDNIFEQSPIAGEKIESGAKVRLFLK